MADADWGKYKQLRGKTLPESIDFRGASYRLETLFKRDFYAATGLYRRADGKGDADRPLQVVLKIYHTEPLAYVIRLGWLGRWLCRREMHYLRQTKGIAGLAQLYEPFGPSGFVREYVPGCHLREWRMHHKPDWEFYRSLKATLAAVHARGMCHNDLNKPENILVRPDGTPVLIDFQIAACFRFRLPPFGWLGRRMLRYMQAMDWYHINKHHTHDRPQDFSPEALKLAKRKGILLTLHGWLLRRPYRAVRHFVMNRFMRVKQPVPSAPAKAA